MREGARFDVTTLGETMLRLSVPAGQRLEDAQAFDAHVGGAETNVCAALASLERSCGWVSRLPEGPIGQLALRRLRTARVDTSAVVLVEDGRLGTYFVELASPPRATRVQYDRKRSAFTGIVPDEVDWGYLLDTRILHLTGITPALGRACRELVQEGLARARREGIFVSFDVNYRRKLWSAREAADALRTIVPHVNLLVCGIADARAVFGCSGSEEEVLSGLRELTAARHIVLTLGEAGVIALDDTRVVRQRAFPSGIVDRLGAGDALAAGVIDGLLDGSFEDGLQRGSALAALALAQAGDMLITDRQELQTVLAATEQRVAR